MKFSPVKGHFLSIIGVSKSPSHARAHIPSTDYIYIIYYNIYYLLFIIYFAERKMRKQRYGLAMCDRCGFPFWFAAKNNKKQEGDTSKGGRGGEYSWLVDNTHETNWRAYEAPVDHSHYAEGKVPVTEDMIVDAILKLSLK